MPLLTDLSQPIEWMDPDLVPRPIVTMGAAGIDMEELAAAGMSKGEAEFHRHKKGQLLFLVRGVFTCEVQNWLWLVPPQCALWVPGNVMHKVTAAGSVECYVTYIDAFASKMLPDNCCTISVTPLLRELLMRSAAFPMLYDEGGKESHLATLLLDELGDAPAGTLQLPMPSDSRLRQIVEQLMENPAERGTMAIWSRRVGLSQRTLARRLVEETGMSFGRWRQQLHLMLAVKWLSTGATVQQVADDLGYESASSFVTMFRKALGTSPGRYTNSISAPVRV